MPIPAVGNLIDFLASHANRVGLIICAGLLLATAGEIAHAGSLVLANRTTHAITIQVGDQVLDMQPGVVRGLRIATSKSVRFTGSLRPFYLVQPDAVYYLGPSPPGRIDLVRIGLGGDSGTSSIFDSDLVLPLASTSPDQKNRVQPSLLTIPVKLLVDDDEAANRTVWEERLRRRLAEASTIFERHCLVRFKVVAVDTWKTDNDIIEFEQSFAEFEKMVNPAPARLAIGFTSQYRVMRERTHLGGTRGPLNSHLLVREWSNRINEPERLEVLVHELGHFLGALHSPEPDSVMRAILGDRKARANSFRIGFDPVNTLAMNYVAEAFPTGRIGRFAHLPLATQLELSKLYREIAVANPHDKTPAQYVQLLDRMGLAPLAQVTRLVVLGVGLAAQRNAPLVESAATPVAAMAPAEGGELFDLYVQTAARVAHHSANPHAARGFLVGLGVAVDRTRSLEQHRLLGPLVDKIESPAERDARLKKLGVPTLHGKHEQARHFALAAALTAVVGPEAAERACLALQLGSSANPGKFSAAVYQADLAGIVFAHRLLTGKSTLQQIGQDFRGDEWLPSVESLQPNGDTAEFIPLMTHTLSSSDFTAQFGSTADTRFRKLRSQLGQWLKQAAALR